MLRQRNLSKQCLFRFLCRNTKIFYRGAVKRFKDCNTPLDHAELLSLSTHVKSSYTERKVYR